MATDVGPTAQALAAAACARATAARQRQFAMAVLLGLAAAAGLGLGRHPKMAARFHPGMRVAVMAVGAVNALLGSYLLARTLLHGLTGSPGPAGGGGGGVYTPPQRIAAARRAGQRHGQRGAVTCRDLP